MPKNLKNEAETAQALEGIVSKETQLSTLSIVEDASEEIKKIKKEEEEERKAAEKIDDKILGFSTHSAEKNRE